MGQFDEAIVSIFELRSIIEHVFFKEFVHMYELPEGVNHTHMMTMMILKFHGSIPMSELSRKLNLEKGSFTPVANKLIKRGLLTKEQSIKDKRVYNLGLSPEGDALATEFSNTHRTFVEGLIKSLEPEEQVKFFDSVNLINTTLLQLTKTEQYQGMKYTEFSNKL